MQLMRELLAVHSLPGALVMEIGCGGAPTAIAGPSLGVDSLEI